MLGGGKRDVPVIVYILSRQNVLPFITIEKELLSIWAILHFVKDIMLSVNQT